jgi:hypothetical protein
MSRSSREGASDESGRDIVTHSGKRLWIIAAISIALLYVVFSVFFAGAQVVIETREQSGAVDSVFSAVAEGGASAPLTYRVVTIEKEATEKLPATGEEYVEKKASGFIVVYNNFGEQPQRLIKNTRFESADGLIYRIPKSIDVPGRQKAGDSYTPGSIETQVFADAPGERYNMAAGTRFTIPGLKGDARFEGFSAEAKTAFEGGFAGVVKTVSAAAEDEARRSLKVGLDASLRAELTSGIPEHSLWYEDAVVTTGGALPPRSEGDMVLVGERAVIHGIVFDQVAFSKHIARATVANFDEGDVVIQNFDELRFELLDKASIDPAQWSEIRFRVAGTPQLRWVFDEQRLREDLAGKSKRTINTVLAGYPAIAKAEVIIRPFWDSTFPKNPDKIMLEFKGGADAAGGE